MAEHAEGAVEIHGSPAEVMAVIGDFDAAARVGKRQAAKQIVKSALGDLKRRVDSA